MALITPHSLCTVDYSSNAHSSSILHLQPRTVLSTIHTRITAAQCTPRALPGCGMGHTREDRKPGAQGADRRVGWEQNHPSTHTQRNTQPHTTTLHCPSSYTALSSFTSHRSVGRRNARGEGENARVQGTGEQDGKWGTGDRNTKGPWVHLGSCHIRWIWVYRP